MAHAFHHGKEGRRPTERISSSARVIGRVKHLLTLLLLLGSMVGLLGVQTAAAATPLPAVAMAMAMPTHAEKASMPADCAAMMSAHAPQPDKQPCTGITLDCIAAMGCAMPFMGTSVALNARAPIAAPKHFLPTALALVGKDLAPEPEPPTILR